MELKRAERRYIILKDDVRDYDIDWSDDKLVVTVRRLDRCEPEYAGIYDPKLKTFVDRMKVVP